MTRVYIKDWEILKMVSNDAIEREWIPEWSSFIDWEFDLWKLYKLVDGTVVELSSQELQNLQDLENALFNNIE